MKQSKFMHITGTAKTKKQAKEGHKNTQNVVCPNCEYHFRVLQISPALLGLQKSKTMGEKETHQTYQNISLQTSRQQIVDWKEFSARKVKQHQKQLIQSIKSKKITTIQKLKNLNDLNQLKRSRLVDSVVIPNTPETNKKSPEKAQPISRQMSIDKVQFTPEKISKTTKEIAFNHQKDQKAIIQQSLNKKIIEQTLEYLIEWLQNCGFHTNLPSFLKQMVENYRHQYQKRKQTHIQLNILAK